MISVALIMAFIAFVPFLVLTLLLEDVPFAVRCCISLFISTPGFLAVLILALRDKLRGNRYEHSRPDSDYMSKSLVSKFKEEFPQIAYELEKDKWKAINIPARDKNVGDMWISADCNNVILGIGDIFHLHFRVDYRQLAPEEAADRAISTALNCVRDFLADRVVLRIKYRNGRPVSTRVFDPMKNGRGGWIVPLSLGNIVSVLLLRKSEVKNFVWSGPCGQ